jgi:hypothetical protein
MPGRCAVSAGRLGAIAAVPVPPAVLALAGVFAIISPYFQGLVWLYVTAPIIALLSIVMIEVTGSYGL